MSEYAVAGIRHSLIFSKCLYVTLSVVDVPPKAPQPSVIDSVSPLVSPSTPCVPGEFTRMRLAGICAAKRWIRVIFRPADQSIVE
jgi:hypothetical protein